MKKSIIVAIVFASIICLSFTGSAKCDGTVISISPSSSTLSQTQIGANFQININISDVTDLWQWKVRLNWNPNILNFSNVTEGSFLKSVGSTLFLNAPQRSGYLPELSDTLLENTSVSGNGTLATVTFKVLAAGQSDMTLTETVLTQPLSGNPPSHSQIAHSVNNSQVTVQGSEQGSESPTMAVLTITIAAIAIIAIISAAILIKRRSKPKHPYRQSLIPRKSHKNSAR